LQICPPGRSHPHLQFQLGITVVAHRAGRVPIDRFRPTGAETRKRKGTRVARERIRLGLLDREKLTGTQHLRKRRAEIGTADIAEGSLSGLSHVKLEGEIS
jgi:hypothetical protein